MAMIEKIVFVNPDKEKRAKEILELFSKTTLTDDQEDMKRKVGNLLADAQIAPDNEAAHRFVYEKVLGGLVRTAAEQKVADKKKEEIQKKRKVDLDSK